MGNSLAQYGLTGRWIRSRAITNADTNTTVAIIDIPAGSFIPPHMTVIQIVTAFAGGVPSIDIGDGDDPNGFISTTEITETTPGTYAGSEATTGAYDQNGKVYLTADQITATVSAALTAGKAYVLAYVINVDDVIND